MKVNDFVKTIGYTRDRLSHFEFCLWDPATDEWINITDADVDDYIHLCDRHVQEWMIENDNTMTLMILMNSRDREVFKDYFVH